MSPVLYIAFNRPDLTAITFEQLRRQRPSVLYVAADAARPSRSGESDACQQVRDMVQQVDWPCESHYLFAENNMGCGRRISSAVTHVLQSHETVIVLEDDCVVEPSFFGYCEQLLEYYRDDTRIGTISGDNFQQGARRSDASYYFSKYPHCWGWATWRRAWKHFSLELTNWPALRSQNTLHHFCDEGRELDYWNWTFDQVHAKKVDSWALPWTLCCWLQNFLHVLPEVNLVSNIGFDAQGTHTTRKASFAELPTFPIGDLVHPRDMYRHREADQFADDLMYSGPWERARRKRKRWSVRRWLPCKNAA